MGRVARIASSTGLYHVIVRGNNKQKIFHSELDFEKYLDLIQISTSKHSVKVYHYCLMTNHVHMLLGSETLEGLSKVIEQYRVQKCQVEIVITKPFYYLVQF